MTYYMLGQDLVCDLEFGLRLVDLAIITFLIEAIKITTTVDLASFVLSSTFILKSRQK